MKGAGERERESERQKNPVYTHRKNPVYLHTSKSHPANTHTHTKTTEKLTLRALCSGHVRCLQQPLTNLHGELLVKVEFLDRPEERAKRRGQSLHHHRQPLEKTRCTYVAPQRLETPEAFRGEGGGVGAGEMFIDGDAQPSRPYRPRINQS